MSVCNSVPFFYPPIFLKGKTHLEIRKKTTFTSYTEKKGGGEKYQFRTVELESKHLMNLYTKEIEFKCVCGGREKVLDHTERENMYNNLKY